MIDTKQTLAIADATAAPPSGRRPAAQDSGPSDTPVRNGHLIGYSRVSTRAQDLALQLDALEHEGCERVYQERRVRVDPIPATTRRLPRAAPPRRHARGLAPGPP